MITRVNRAKEGFADYLISGARKDSIYKREQKDRTITLYGNLETFKQTEKYLNKFKNYESNYIHITLSFSQEDMNKLNEIDDEQKRDELFKELALIYIKHHTSGYNLENEVIAYAEAHLPKIQLNEKNKQRFPHIHIAIAKYNPLDDTQLRTTFFNSSYMDDVLQSYVCKKYGFEIPRKDEKNETNFNEEVNYENKIRSKIAITRANWIELLKDIKTSDELLYFLKNDLKLEENVHYKIAGTKTYKYIKILNLQERNKKSNSLNVNGKQFERFIIKDDKNRTFPRHKSKEELGEILQSYYRQRKEYILKRRSKKTKEKLNEIYESQTATKINTNTKNSFKYLSYQQKLFDQHYDYLIKDKLEGYYIKKVNNEVIINNFSKNIQIIDAGDEIVSLKKTTNLQEQVRIMIDIALAKGWKLENIEAIGDDSFIYEVNRQIAKAFEEKNKSKNIDSEIMITRAKTELQQQSLNIKDKELTVNLSEIKEKLDINLVLEFVVQNYKLDRNKYEITSDNKINNLINKQKPKNVIDFLQRELNLSTRESIEICTKIYEKNKQYRSQNIPNYRKKQKN
ncbi:hypothetical protein [Aliarcobacter cryaerophilus]|uniref:Large polyvalent protein-associated domain-containing protein n=2 Tax=unclassified Arcobacter TaxID=2593671 RepID=A0AA96IC38_9BACT|nr:hypothetical protein RJG52_07560 [Arcobacter sp. AZ-2023]WPD10399.1 hypothetical protein QUR77_03300 [Arcobacter sp. DSM 115954]WNL15229.1 hypothetical protein RJG51_03310 [Arcobacter sp. AZ-2023]WNL18889.1 hypothetical protein RJG53_09930 [Arcobacter sp. AZ-2023]WNL21028.1 hypothetical protein RJG56_09810 [Arcobacter sp. AZ-2023]